MQRITEPELMNDEAQALAYAQADFDEPHDMFIQVFKDTFPEAKVSDHILDLGCGPADISIRFARAYPDCEIDGLLSREITLPPDACGHHLEIS